MSLPSSLSFKASRSMTRISASKSSSVSSRGFGSSDTVSLVGPGTAPIEVLSC